MSEQRTLIPIGTRVRGQPTGKSNEYKLGIVVGHKRHNYGSCIEVVEQVQYDGHKRTNLAHRQVEVV